ncbi:MAG: superoxide dismutase [Candidatus Zambryskibacteria bacterium]|nr:superoxide dismutase [Candidatus Zambryskibacteria bacterium]
MKLFEEKKFNIPKLEGISEKTIKEHLQLYAGYVKNVNELLQEKNYNRRFPFEFDGMRNHEIYFSHLEGGPTPLLTESPLSKVDWEQFKTMALTRGVGWATLYYDQTSKQLISAWVDEHHLGVLTGLSPILVLDMWEHAYFTDYTPAEKKKYIEAFFANLNWQTCEDNFLEASGGK